ncbi:MAG: GH92 family glycosyl hydrolase [Bacteroidota bacterium]|nr:GH92 family glycosyl hydrolase [Bacteroidota bacterium]
MPLFFACYDIDLERDCDLDVERDCDLELDVDLDCDCDLDLDFDCDCDLDQMGMITTPGTETMRILVLVTLGLLCVSRLTAQQVEDPAAFVDPFLGTGAHGHTFPGATMPFGMVQVSPDAGKSGWDWCSGYHASDSAVIGFSHSHLSGTGCADLGDVLLLPTTSTNALDRQWRTPYDHAHEDAAPGSYRVLLSGGIEVELGATRRCGVQKYAFPEADSMLVILDLGYGQDDRPTGCRLTVVNDTLITGSRSSTGWAARQRVFFAMAFSRPLEHWRGADGEWQFPSGTVEAKAVLAALHFGFAGEGDELLIRTGISSVSEEGALANLRAETPHQDFERYRREARAAWNRELSRIRIAARSETDRRTFLTALYHTMIAPNLYMDTDGRYRGGDDTVHIASGFEHATVFSLWDTYRALHPLFTILDPKRVSDWVASMLAFRRETGLLPVWTLHANETNCMIGYHAVPVIADAILKGIGGFSAEDALDAMKRNAEQDKGGLKFYTMREARSIKEALEPNVAPSLVFRDIWDGVTAAVNGYASTVRGQEIDYHSAIPSVNHALITRASEQPMPVEWLSAPLPDNHTGGAVLVWPAGMSTAKGGHRFTLTVDGTHTIAFRTPGTRDTVAVVIDENGMKLRFLASLTDHFGDHFGTMMLALPPELCHRGRPLHLRLEGEHAGSSDWVMTFTHSFAPSVTVVNGHGVARREAEQFRFLRLQVERMGLPVRFHAVTDAMTVDGTLMPGFTAVEVPIKEKPDAAVLGVELAIDGAAAVAYTVAPRATAAPCYVPADVENESVSKTLEYAYDDWCIAEVAKKLGRTDDAARYAARSQYYRELFDTDLGFMRGRNLDGSFRSPFNPRFSTLKQHEYTEGNAWQYSWYVPHDVAGLIDLHGGRERFARKLDSLFEQSSDLEDTGATADVSGLIGLYAHGNEPSHHIPYLYNHAGQPWKTQAYVRRILREMYHDRRDGLCGNEDCGQMSAWYVLSAMGFYPLNPCGGEYEIGSPLLDRAEIDLGDGRRFVIVAENNSEENVYVQHATLDGVPLGRPLLRHADIQRGGELRLRMGPNPSALWTMD